MCAVLIVWCVFVALFIIPHSMLERILVRNGVNREKL